MPSKTRSHRPHSTVQRDESREREQVRGSAATRGYGRRWQRLRKMKLAETPVCETPGCMTLATDVDHIVAKVRGGDDDWANLRALCHACHSRKTATVDRRRRKAEGEGGSNL